MRSSSPAAGAPNSVAAAMMTRVRPTSDRRGSTDAGLGSVRCGRSIESRCRYYSFLGKFRALELLHVSELNVLERAHRIQQFEDVGAALAIGVFSHLSQHRRP